MCARGREIRRERMRERATEKEREKEVFGGIFLLQRDVYLGILVSTSRSLLLGLIFPEKTYLIFFPVYIKLASGFWNQADGGTGSPSVQCIDSYAVFTLTHCCVWCLQTQTSSVLPPHSLNLLTYQVVEA